MAAIVGLEDHQVVHSVCNTSVAGFRSVLAAVNFNAPGQVVIAGHVAAVERAMISSETDAGAKMAVKLPVSVPSHCELMREVQQKNSMLKLQGTSDCYARHVTLIHNVDVAAHTCSQK
jgi:[acyl-carrier-protein] S-malonyltransferase